MKHALLLLLLAPSLAFGSTCTITSLPDGVSGQAPDTPITCDGKSGFTFIKSIAPDQQKAGVSFTPANDLTVYSNTKDTMIDDGSNPVLAQIKGAGAAGPSCAFSSKVELMTANVPNDAGAACQVQICSASVQCLVKGVLRPGHVTHLTLADGTCPSDPAVYVNDQVLNSQKVSYQDPTAAKTADNAPADGTPNCAYASVSLLKGNIPGCGAVTLCDPQFTCSKTDNSNVIRGVGVATYNTFGACGLDPSALQSPTAGCWADANKCRGDKRVSYADAPVAGAAPAAASTSGSGSTAPVR